jgi:predicted DNA helicase
VILQLVKKGKRILAAADSNTAVDNLVEKLHNSGVKVLRIGNPARVDPALYSVSLDYRLQDEPDFQYAMKLRNDVALIKEKQEEFVPASGQNRRGLSDDEIVKLAKRGVTKRGIPLTKIRRMAGWVRLQKKVNASMREIRELEEKAVQHLLSDAAVVCSTHVSSGAELMQDFRFDVAVIDEATQAMEPSCLIPMVKAKKWILTGDHKQLPPTVLSREASALNYTLFERWMTTYEREMSEILTVQYRMNKKIMRFPNDAFYDGLLKAHPSVQNHTISGLSGFSVPGDVTEPWKTVVNPDVPVCFIHVDTGREDKIEGSFSYFNRAEIYVVKEVLHNLLACRLFPSDIGIISPYEQQVNVLKGQLGDAGVDIKTVDGYQGREKEVIILSLVRANPEGTLGFLTDYRRLNVAVTRARRKLIVIGHQPTLEKNEVYKKLLDSIDVNLSIPGNE